MNKKVINGDSVTYVIEEPTEKAQAVAGAILDAMERTKVHPAEVMPVLGEAVIEFLHAFADTVGYEPLSVIKSFGEGIYTAELECHEKGGQDDGNTSH